MITCTRKLNFCAGHRVFGHENKCANLHGHNYEVHITAQAGELDNIGRVIDFSELKGRIGSWIEDVWDHGFLLWEEDADAITAMQTFKSKTGKQKLFLLPFNPTAENMADYLLKTVCPEKLEGTGITVTRVVLWETPNCYAEASVEAQVPSKV